MNIDLDAVDEAAAAKRETEAETDPPTVKFRGETFTLPHGPMPGELILAIGDLQSGNVAALREAMVVLLGADGFDTFMGLRDANGRGPTMAHMQALIEGASKAYGEEVGNSLPSSGSPDVSGGPSSPTANGSTASTPATSGEDASRPAVSASS